MDSIFSFKGASKKEIIGRKKAESAPQIQEKCRNCGVMITATIGPAIRRADAYADFSCHVCGERWGHVMAPKKDVKPNPQLVELINRDIKRHNVQIRGENQLDRMRKQLERIRGKGILKEEQERSLPV